MAWRIIVKTVKGHRYRYRQRSFRVGGKVKTESVYLGRADGPAGDAEPAAKPSQAAKSAPRSDDGVIAWLMEPKNAKPWRRPYAASRAATFTNTLPLDRRILSLPIALGVRISSRPWPDPHPKRDSPWYAPKADHIQLPDPTRLPARNPRQSAARYHQFLLHELVHATRHPSRLDRLNQGSSRSSRYAWEEMVAEIGSWLVLNRIAPGEDPLPMSAHYVQHFARQARPQDHRSAFAEAKRAADYILEHWPDKL